MNIPTQTLLPIQTILESTFNIFYNEVNGTSFIVNGNNGQYLITAKHIFGNTIVDRSSVEVIIKGGQIDQKITCNVFFNENSQVDIAVLQLKTQVINGRLLPLKRGESYFLAQQCLFLGFPLFQLGTQTQSGKVAFVKKAIVSALYEENGTEIMLLDGHNNPGFSGGPIITYSETMEKQFIIGVISGYFYQKNNLKIDNGITKETIQINENSGIIISYASGYILDIINKIEQE